MLARLLLFAIVLGSAQAQGATPRRASGKLARVSYVTGSRAYLSFGSEQGIAVGQRLKLRRRGRSVGTCTVDQVAPRHASCTGASAHVGDTVLLPSQPPVTRRKRRKVPRTIPATALARQRAQVEAARFEPFAYSPPTLDRFARVLRGEVSVQHGSWVSTTPQATFHQQRVDVRLSGAEVARGWDLFVDATAVTWTGRPRPPFSYYPVEGNAQLLVRELAIRRDAPDEPFTFSVGRIWAQGAANLGVFDGANLAWRNRSGTLEVGAFAGAMPEPVLLTPTLAQPLAGASVRLRSTRRDGVVRWIEQETRISYGSGTQGDAGWELAALARAAFAGDVHAAADVRVEAGAEQIHLGAVRLDLAARPWRWFSLDASGRYEVARLDPLPGLENVFAGHPRWGTHARAQFVVAPWMTASWVAGNAMDATTTLARAWTGPEISFPTLFGSRGGLTLVHQEEFGWIGGRASWAQAVLRPVENVDLLGRVVWFRDAIPVPSGVAHVNEAGGYLSVGWRLSEIFTLRASVLGRVDLFPAPEDREGTTPQPSGAIASASLNGRF